MAKPLTFKPAPVDFKADLIRRLETAPEDHVAALLAAYDVLQVAHDKGILDLLHGLIGSKDAIIAKLADAASTPEGITGIRNLLSGAKALAALNPEILDHLSKVVAALDPEIIDHLSKIITAATEEHKLERHAPSLWEIVKRTTSEDSRRGLSFLTILLSGFGKSLKE
jgi:uncharacterized protein YjgD (DUF1641 family)